MAYTYRYRGRRSGLDEMRNQGSLLVDELFQKPNKDNESVLPKEDMVVQPTHTLTTVEVPIESVNSPPIVPTQSWVSEQLGILKSDETQLISLLREKNVRESLIVMAISRIRTTGESLIDVLGPMDYAVLSSEEIAEIVADMQKIPFINKQLAEQLMDPVSLAENGLLFTPVKEMSFVPLCFDDNKRLKVVLQSKVYRNEAVTMFHQFDCDFYIGSRGLLSFLFRRMFGKTKERFFHLYEAFQKALTQNDDLAAGRLRTEIYFSLLRHACFMGASDIYFQPLPSMRGGQVFLRIDGIRRSFCFLEWRIYERLMKLMKEDAKVTESEFQYPIEGFVQFQVGGDDSRMLQFGDLAKRYVFRSELIPARPESQNPGMFSQVIRIQDSDSEIIDLKYLGLDAKTLSLLELYFHKRGGIFCMTGPVGSGKTTLMNACMRHFLDPIAKSTQTVENPIEIMQGTWLQYQVNRRDSEEKGATMLSTALLRNAPDFVLLGETRTPEMAINAVKMSNMGFTAATTLHNNWSSSAIARWEDLGISRSQIAASVSGVMALALVLRLCFYCRAIDDRESTREYLKKIESEISGGNFPEPSSTMFRLGKGCSHCDSTGFKGRTLIFELLDFNPTVQNLVLADAPIIDIQRTIPIRESLFGRALQLVLDGVIHIEQAKSLEFR